MPWFHNFTVYIHSLDTLREGLILTAAVMLGRDGEADILLCRFGGGRWSAYYMQTERSEPEN